jgi:hypothetical protein
MRLAVCRRVSRIGLAIEGVEEKRCDAKEHGQLIPISYRVPQGGGERCPIVNMIESHTCSDQEPAAKRRQDATNSITGGYTSPSLT